MVNWSNNQDDLFKTSPDSRIQTPLLLLLPIPFRHWGGETKSTRLLTPRRMAPFDERGGKRSDLWSVLDLLQLGVLNRNARPRPHYRRHFDRLHDAHAD